MANEFEVVVTQVEPSPLAEISAEMGALGPKRVRGKEFEAEQFDPLVVQKLLERRTVRHPTFGSMIKTQVVSKRAQSDICPGEGSCGCQ